MITDQNQVNRYCCLIGIVFMTVANTTLAAPKQEAIIGSQEYQGVFEAFYKDLSHQPIDLLIYQLNNRIETILMTGGHITAPDLQHHIEKISAKIYAAVTQEMCPWKSGKIFSNLERERISLRAVRDATQGKNISMHDYATTVAVLVRILERAANKVCDRKNFYSLGS